MQRPPTDAETFYRTLSVKIDRFVLRGRKAELKQYLATHLIMNELYDSPVDTLFEYAILASDNRMADVFLDIGAKLNGDEHEAFPPLFYAVEAADADLSMFHYLLERGADPNVHMINDYTPLHKAAIEDKPIAARLLIDAGADIDAETRIDDYRTPAMEASAHGHIEILRLLLEAGANTRHKNFCGESIADVAAVRSRRLIADLLAKATP